MVTTSASIGGVIGEPRQRRRFSLQYKGASIMAMKKKKGGKRGGKKGGKRGGRK